MKHLAPSPEFTPVLVRNQPLLTVVCVSKMPNIIYPEIESIGSIGSLMLGTLEVQVCLFCSVVSLEPQASPRRKRTKPPTHLGDLKPDTRT